MTVVVNITGQPSAGKSTMAAEVFAGLKKRGVDVELVTEYTKELILMGDEFRLQDEIIVFAEKYTRLKKMQNADVIITDSPLYHSAIYGSKQLGEAGTQLVMDVYNRFDNLNFFVEPAFTYVPKGRATEKEAVQRGKEINDFLEDSGIEFSRGESHPSYCAHIIQKVISKVGKSND